MTHRPIAMIACSGIQCSLVTFVFCERSGDGVLRRRKRRNGSRFLQLPVPAGRRLCAVVHFQRAVLRLGSPVRHHLVARSFRRAVCRGRVPAATEPRPYFRSRDRRGAAMKRTK